MRTLRELLLEADPLQHETARPPGERDLRRQAVLTAASASRVHAGVLSRSRIVIFAGAALVLIVVSSLGSRLWSPLVSVVQGAVRFEVRLAETKPGPGLREAKLSGSDQSVYLHSEVVVDNSDIAMARVIQPAGSSQYAVDIKFNASGAEKMPAATRSHLGKLAAILLDGRVVMAPVIRSPISESAIISGNFTKAQAERIVSGIAVQ